MDMDNKKKVKSGQTRTQTGRKTASSRTTAKNTAEKSLQKELAALIPRLDEEGLRFLIQQAQVHLYNMQVDALNQNMIRDEAAAKAPKPAKPGKAGLSLKTGDSKSSFYLAYGGDWVMFTDTEILSLAKIASGPDSDRERGERIYNWFNRERRDVFATVPIEDQYSPILVELVKLLKKNFKVRK